MRIFIAFALLLLLHLSAVSAAKHESNAITYKTAIKKHSIFKKSNKFSQKEVHSFSNGPITENLDRINQTLGNRLISIPISELCNIDSFVPSSNQNLKNFENTIVFSYQFTFNCLYPKHTFW